MSDKVEFGSALDTLGWLVDVKGREEHQAALQEIKATLDDAYERLSRAHDSADSYQIRALAAEAREQRLLAKIARVEDLVIGYREFVHCSGGATGKVVEAYELVIEELEEALKGGEP